MAREFYVNDLEDEEVLFPFPYVVTSRLSYDSYEKPVFVENWESEEMAMKCGRERHKQGFVVTVALELAFTIGEAGDE